MSAMAGPATAAVTPAQIQAYKVNDFSIAVNYINAAQQAWQAYQNKTLDIGTAVNRANGDLNNALTWLHLSYNWMLYQYSQGDETLSQAQGDQKVLNAAAQLAQQDINFLWSSPGYIGSLVNIDGHYVGDLPNYFNGSNMSQS
jgi:hypothetical protein